MEVRIFNCMVMATALFVAMSVTANANETTARALRLAQQPLADTKPGNLEKGKDVYIHRKKGNCLACHGVKELETVPFHGEVGPPLDDVGGRLSESQIRLQLIDAKVNNPDSIMPAYYRSEGLNRVLKKWKGKTILSAQEIEDVVAYLMTLKGE